MNVIKNPLLQFAISLVVALATYYSSISRASLEVYYESNESEVLIYFLNSGNTTLELKENLLEPLVLELSAIGAGYWCFYKFPRAMPAAICQLTEGSKISIPNIILEAGEFFGLKYPLMGGGVDVIGVEGKVAGVKRIKYQRLNGSWDEIINRQMIYFYKGLEYFGYLFAAGFLMLGGLSLVGRQSPMQERRDIFNRIAGRVGRGREYIYPFEMLYSVRFFDFSKAAEVAANAMKQIHDENNLVENFNLLKESWFYGLNMDSMSKSMILHVWQASGILDKIEKNPTVLEDMIYAYAEFSKMKEIDKSEYLRQHMRNGAV